MHDRPESRRKRNNRRWHKDARVREESSARCRRKVVEFQMWLAEYLHSHPCVDCGELDITVLEFDHVVKDENNRDVTSMAMYSRRRVLEEINKCEVVCANDHTRRTAERANTIRWQRR